MTTLQTQPPSATTATAQPNTSQQRRAFVLIENPAKSTNWGPILRCCAAFGIPIVVAVGYDKCAVQGSHGASKHVQIVAFPTHGQAVEFLKTELDCPTICGILGAYGDSYDHEGYNVQNDDAKGLAHVQIQSTVSSGNSNTAFEYPKSYPVTKRQFASTAGNVCFALGKKGKGLPIALAQICTSFCHVPHLDCGFNEDQGMDNTMMNIETCFSIILHNFMLLTGYTTDTDFQGQKYHVEKVVKGAYQDADRAERERLERLERKERLAEEDIDSGDMGNLFGQDGDGGGGGDY